MNKVIKFFIGILIAFIVIMLFFIAFLLGKRDSQKGSNMVPVASESGNGMQEQTPAPAPSLPAVSKDDYYYPLQWYFGLDTENQFVRYHDRPRTEGTDEYHDQGQTYALDDPIFHPSPMLESVVPDEHGNVQFNSYMLNTRLDENGFWNPYRKPVKGEDGYWHSTIFETSMYETDAGYLEEEAATTEDFYAYLDYNNYLPYKLSPMESWIYGPSLVNLEDTLRTGYNIENPNEEAYVIYCGKGHFAIVDVDQSLFNERSIFGYRYYIGGDGCLTYNDRSDIELFGLDFNVYNYDDGIVSEEEVLQLLDATWEAGITGDFIVVAERFGNLHGAMQVMQEAGWEPKAFLRWAGSDNEYGGQTGAALMMDGTIMEPEKVQVFMEEAQKRWG